jgi:hypothetical protein
MHNQKFQVCSTRVGVIGGGVGGATIALRLSELGAKVTLFEKENSLINGPPMCHLHAGGNLYREISDQQCIDLLKQSIDTARLYQDAIDYRPTVVAVPTYDDGNPQDILDRLTKLQHEYAKLIDDDPQNQVLGPASEYFIAFERDEIEKLADLPTPEQAVTPEQWMIAFAKSVDLNQLKFPVILVQEYGISVFRLAAITSLALEKSDNCQLLTNTKVTSLEQSKNSNTWTITTESNDTQSSFDVDYLINACGFQTGDIDDMVGLRPKRMVEFKAAYISHWQGQQSNWPEVVFHGTRGTKNGMTQLTPYPNGYFQIHAMTPDITLFEDGLVASNNDSAQPQLPIKFLAKVNEKWDSQIVQSRTEKAIDKVTHFIPSFSNATLGAPPMFGAQQIPGDDPTLRVADVTFQHDTYARCEIVKASSALPTANAIIDMLVKQQLLPQHHELDNTDSISKHLTELEIAQRAEKLSLERGFPKALAGRTRASTIENKDWAKIG